MNALVRNPFSGREGIPIWVHEHEGESSCTFHIDLFPDASPSVALFFIPHDPRYLGAESVFLWHYDLPSDFTRHNVTEMCSALMELAMQMVQTWGETCGGDA